MIFVPLGTLDAKPGTRLEQIIANTKAAKEELRTLSKEASKDYALLAIGLSEGIGAVGLRKRMAPLANLGISNVPGPGICSFSEGRSCSASSRYRCWPPESDRMSH